MRPDSQALSLAVGYEENHPFWTNYLTWVTLECSSRNPLCDSLSETHQVYFYFTNKAPCWSLDMYKHTQLQNQSH